MKNQKWMVITGLSVLVCFLALTGCGGGNDSGEQTQPPPPPPVIPDSPAGDWSLYGVSAGDRALGGWVGWWQGELTFDADGRPTAYHVEYEDGSEENTAPFYKLSHSTNQENTIRDLPSYHGVTSRDNTLSVATSMDIDGGIDLYISQRHNPTIVTTDFAGQYIMHALVTGDDPEFSGWYRGTVNVSDTNAVDINFMDNLGLPLTGNMQAESAGNDILQTPRSRWTMSWDKQSIVGRASYRNGYALEVGIRPGSNMQLDNLIGTWRFHTLVSGDAPRVNAWGNGLINIADSGEMTVQYQHWSEAGVTLHTAMMSIDATGKLLSPALDQFEGQLSADGNLFIASLNYQYTSTTPPSPAPGLLIGVRVDPHTITVQADHATTASSDIDPAVGGTIEATSSAGVHYRLDIPANAISAYGHSDVRVSITPLSDVGNIALSGTTLGAVQFEPEGLQLLQPAQLTITWPTAVDTTTLLALRYQSTGDKVQFLPLMPQYKTATSVSLPIHHFSGGAVGTGTREDIDAYVHDSATKEHYEKLLAAELFDAETFDGHLDAIESIMTSWYNLAVFPGLNELNDPTLSVDLDVFQFAAAEFFTWLSKLQMTPIEDRFTASIAGGIDLIVTIINNNFTRLNDACLADIREHNVCYGRAYVSEALQWIIFSQQLGADLNPSDFCDGIYSQLPTAVTIDPNRAMIVSGGSTQLTGYAKDLFSIDMPLTWRSDDESVATVDSNGLVSYVSPGVARITASDSNQCLSDHADVYVAGGYSHWQVESVARSYDSCGISPESIFTDFSITLSQVIGENWMEWRYISSGIHSMSMRGRQNDRLFSLSGYTIDKVQPVYQDCEVRLISDNKLTATCHYNDPYARCSGDFIVTGRKLQEYPLF